MKWYRILFSGEYVVLAESEEQAKEFFEIEDINNSESISVDFIEELEGKEK